MLAEAISTWAATLHDKTAWIALIILVVSPPCEGLSARAGFRKPMFRAENAFLSTTYVVREAEGALRDDQVGPAQRLPVVRKYVIAVKSRAQFAYVG